VQVQVPEALRDIGYSNEEICREVPLLLVLKRFRQGVISSGKAARILGMTRREFLDLLGREGVPIYDPTDEQLTEERTTLERL
jgi:predicted HTH domain antitoxin